MRVYGYIVRVYNPLGYVVRVYPTLGYVVRVYHTSRICSEGVSHP